MTVLEHALNWVKGEVFEASMLALWGTLLVVLALFFWKFGFSATTRALIAPVLAVGLFWGVAGGAALYVNSQRPAAYTAAYEQDARAFVASEDQRVERFIWVYPYLLAAWAVLILLGLAAFMLWGGNTGRAVGLGLILFGVSGLLVDHTSEHNAHAYRAELDKALQSVR